MRLTIPNHDPTPSPEDLMLMGDRITRALSGLTPDEIARARMVAKGLTDIEIGRHRGINPGTARERIARMRAKARRSEQA